MGAPETGLGWAQGSFHPDLNVQREFRSRGLGQIHAKDSISGYQKAPTGLGKARAGMKGVTALPSLGSDLAQTDPDPRQGCREVVLCAHCGHKNRAGTIPDVLPIPGTAVPALL